MKKYFITFGAGGNNYTNAGKRLVYQVRSTQLFDNHILYTDKYLKKDKQFWNKHSDFISKNRRGYGYWIWKPYIIKKTMERMKDGDILFYLDCGCEIDVRKKDIIKKYFDYVKKDKIVGFKVGFKEKMWTKMDLFIKLNMLDKKHTDSGQYGSGCIMFLVCPKTRKLVNEWYDIVCDYHLVDDSPSIKQNFNEFKENRHDQSIYSLLIKKYDMISSHSLIHIVEILRNKSGVSKIIK